MTASRAKDADRINLKDRRTPTTLETQFLKYFLKMYKNSTVKPQRQWNSRDIRTPAIKYYP
jgi:hypothetical protein